MASPNKNQNKGFFSAMTSSFSMFGTAMQRSVNGMLGYEGMEVINPEGGKDDAEEEAQRGRWKQEAIQQGHAFHVKFDELKAEVTQRTNEASKHLSDLNKAEARVHKLNDKVKAAQTARNLAEKKTEEAEAVAEVAKSEVREAENKKAEAEEELRKALAIKAEEIKAADEKGYADGQAAVRDAYKSQVQVACNRGYQLGWLAALDALNIPADSPLRLPENVKVPYPPPQSEEGSDEDGSESDKGEPEAEAEMNNNLPSETKSKSPTPQDQVVDLVEDEELVKEPEVSTEQVAEVAAAERRIEDTLKEIDAEILAEKSVPVPAEVETEADQAEVNPAPST